MNVKRFTGRNSREAMQKVKAAFGNDAVVLSTKPAAEGGIEILAMAADSVPAMDHYAVEKDAPELAPRESRSDARSESRGESRGDSRTEPRDEAVSAQPRKAVGKQAKETMANLASTVQDDVKQLAMSTLSFQDYVRERMLKRRQAAMQARTEPAMALPPEEQLNQRFAQPKPQRPAVSTSVDLTGEAMRGRSAPAADEMDQWEQPVRQAPVAQPRQPAPAARPQAVQQAKPAAQVVPLRSEHADLTMDKVTPARDAVRVAQPDAATLSALKAAQEANASMLGELRAMREMMKERFETMAFIEKLGRTPAQAQLAQRLLDAGFSAVLVRKMLDAMPAEVTNGSHDEVQWATQVLQRNVNTADHELPIEDQGGVFALIGSTGVGKTTSTAKLAATFAAKHGASNLGLITLDAYRVGAHEQLRAYGRILGVPVHMAHDRAALEDLLELLSSKKLILIDTAGMAQRDGRTKELLDMLAHPSIRKLLVINTAAQGDSIEDVMHSYHAEACAGVVLSKLDEAVKLGPALDALIRHKLKVLGVANGQRVPEDWHRLSAQALVHRALRASLNPAYRLDPNEVSLMFSGPAATGPLSNPRHV
ncbi:MAG: flagellar biosynthesis protein FlhF [Aquabacterium sp.]|uniref:flagellar biosynthesis protein FlhF n=1 Tax=Aquabacterium sp. TaxID=1872578 RepID=UPI0025BD977B|nr:flagellar biosynthesis protein FlhF [Aquabacterium sp.]MBI3380885.1 flagellar biosynthesis protein FlhF [Aquabacterium sp.]